MNNSNNRFLSAPDYFYLRDIGIPYEGYVEGMGYVSQDIAIVPPVCYAYENPPRSVHPADSGFIVMNVARLDYSADTVARSYHVTAEDITNQIVRDGYTISPEGQRIPLPTNYSLSVNIESEGYPGNIRDTVHIKVKDEDTGSYYESQQSMANYLDRFNDVLDVVGITMDGIELSRTSKSFSIFRNNGKTFSPKVYNSGWGGGSAGNIKTFKIVKVAKAIGDRLFFVSMGIDAYLLINGSQNLSKTAMNIGVGFLCYSVITGPAGLIIGISYFVLDQCGLIDPIADWVQDAFTHRPQQLYRPDPNVIQSDNTRVVIQRSPLPIIIRKD